MPAAKKIRVMALSRFDDLQERVTRDAGDEFDATSERVNEINNAGYGVLVVPVAKEPLSPAANRTRAKQS